MKTEEKIVSKSVYKYENETKPCQSKLIEATVIFGNPKCNCENYGICKISEGFELFNELHHNNKAKALLRYSHSKAELSILISSIPSETKAYQFKNFSFNVISKYTIPNSVISTPKNIKLFIRPGLYTYRNKDIFKIKIDTETNIIPNRF